MLSRRTFGVALAGGVAVRAADSISNSIRRAPAHVEAGAHLDVQRRWTGSLCRSRVVNRGNASTRVERVVLFDLAHRLSPETALYGESFQMLSQTAGTLGAPLNLAYSEVKHYRIPQPADVQTVLTGLMTLSPPGSPHALLAFTSCRRFIGRFYLRPGTIQVVMETEGVELAPGESLDLEEFTIAEGADRASLLDTLAQQISKNHPPLAFPSPPTGWCSWYCFGPRVTAQNVLDNLDAISRRFPALKYVQIDDGYQLGMGDWLDTGAAFGGDLKGVLREIRRRGFEPAIWVAPFIAEAKSKVFQEHPDWFMQADDGSPLSADRVTFQGWRRGPWYALDGTHQAVQKHLENTFRVMRREWGCTYFKLDANFWGAMHGGRLRDRSATRIQAYRRGMEAILRGAGDAFILGCNHPIWPSFGLIHGSRSSGDVSRKWTTLSKIARENLSRNWQNGRLWWNDPDAVVLAGALPLNEFQFHATAVYASGGMILSGDDLAKIPDDRAQMLQKLLPPTGRAAKFSDASLTLGTVDLPVARMICAFNWNDEPGAVSLPSGPAAEISDFWTNEHVGKLGAVKQVELAPRSAKLLRCVRAG
ncbi:MAG TPA: glycoside hydrolase family 36 protein [Bryobacteraceae bacterium]|nr:glycoside hydrolase family 36 protein [Bryobacteraceae bacterium]